ncbi:MAG: alpha/beta fold hydrolase [Acidimicrobiia bacterium]|nr:alpha/beta fold hydrolase [Acidimicrobiia bacterium]
MHSTIVGRVFRYLGPIARPVQILHDAVAGAVYAAVPIGARLVGAGADLARGPGDGYPATTAVVNALWGDTLAGASSPLAVGPSIRGSDGRTVGSVAVGPNVVVLLHGLGQTESCWLRHGSESLGQRLDEEAGTTPLLVRYNTGLPVSRNGRAVSDLLEGLLSERTDQIETVSLIGFSMGGLVARAALDSAPPAARWPTLLRHVVTIGSPHRGTPLAAIAPLASRALGIAATTRPLATMVERRSRGLKDMDGSHAGGETFEPAPGPGRPRHHYVAATITGDMTHPIGAVMGDLVVGVGSATGPAVTTDNVRVVGGVRHFDLLGSEAVVDQVVDWVRAT